MAQAKNSTEVLKAVKWILTNIGWTKGNNYLDTLGKPLDHTGLLSEDLYPKVGSVCLNGALNLVEADNATKEISRTLLLSEIDRTTNNHYETITSFNDRSYSKEDVLALLDRAIKRSAK